MSGAGPQPGRTTRRTALVLAMTVVQAGLAAALVLPLAGVPVPAGGSVPWWVLALLYLAAELCVLDLQDRGTGSSVALSDVPTVIGLFCASPLALVGGRLAGSVVAYALRRRPPLRTAWNMALYALQAAVSLAVFDLVRAGDDAGPRTWVAAVAAAVVADWASVVCIELVLAVHGQRLTAASWREAFVSDLSAPAGAVIGLVAVTSLVAAPVNGWLLLAAGLVVLLVFRSYSRLHAKNLELERLRRFAQVASGWPRVDEVLGDVRAEARHLLLAERADLHLVDDPAAAGEDAWVVGRVVEQGGPVLAPRGTRDGARRRWLAARRSADAIAVPLLSGEDVLGVLVVSDRERETRPFDDDDVRLLQTVAEHAATALATVDQLDVLRHQALHDPLTGLPNRAHLHRRLAAVLAAVADGTLAGAAVMVLDLDGFKTVNDTLGHERGDRLLAEVGRRLAAAVGPEDVVARLGGDEFAVLVPGDDDVAGRALSAGRRVLAALDLPVDLDGTPARVGGSLGVALAPDHGTDASTLLRCADAAMYRAKTAAAGLHVHAPEGTPARQ